MTVTYSTHYFDGRKPTSCTMENETSRRPRKSKYSNLRYFTFDEDLGGGDTRPYYFRAASAEEVAQATDTAVECIVECGPKEIQYIKQHWIRPAIIIDGELIEREDD